MARTNATKVRGVIEVEDPNLDLTPFIDSANFLVTEVCAPLGYDSTGLELIERWLAAHFYAVRDPRRSSEMAGMAQDVYESKVDLGLKVTRFGQQAMRLDYRGGLAAMDNNLNKTTGRKVSFAWLGRGRC